MKKKYLILVSENEKKNRNKGLEATHRSPVQNGPKCFNN